MSAMLRRPTEQSTTTVECVRSVPSTDGNSPSTIAPQVPSRRPNARRVNNPGDISLTWKSPILGPALRTDNRERPEPVIAAGGDVSDVQSKENARCTRTVRDLAPDGDTIEVSRLSENHHGRMMQDNETSQPAHLPHEHNLIHPQADTMTPTIGQQYFTIPISPYPEDMDMSGEMSAELGGFDTGDIDFTQTYNAPDLLWLESAIINLPKLDSVVPSLPTPGEDHELCQDQLSNHGLSADRLSRVQKAWPTKLVRPIRLIRRLWQTALQHPADNILCHDSTESPSQSPQRSNLTGSRWNMDASCRDRLLQDSHKIFGKEESPYAIPVDQTSNTPQSPLSMTHEAQFPSVEMLDMSLDLYFQRFHPSMPFIHQATFDARSAPSAVLFPMCLIGLSSLDPRGSRDFVRTEWTKLVHASRLELTSQALGKRPPLELITAVAASLLVLNLALCISVGFGRPDQLLLGDSSFIASDLAQVSEKHGLFAACDGQELDLGRMGPATDLQRLWKPWARVESVKRMITCLLIIDATYASLWGTAGVVELDKLEIIAPCKSSLFEAPNATTFSQEVEKTNAQIIMPRMTLQRMSMLSPAMLGSMGLQALLAAISLQHSVARHRLYPGQLDSGGGGGGSDETQASSAAPVERYAMDEHAKNIAPLLAAIPSSRSDYFDRENPHALLLWNSLCMSTTADMDQFELALGRKGAVSAQSALANITAWAKSPAARRAALHASQIFWILSQSRVSEPALLLHEHMIFTAALVLAFYVLKSTTLPTSPSEQGAAAAAAAAAALRSPVANLELLQEIDWAEVGTEGFGGAKSQVGHCCPAKRFIRSGGCISFGALEAVGERAARKIILNYAHLLDEVAKWEGSEYCEALKAIGDFFKSDSTEA
ncbi:hypothetical protein G647_02341 [Cladophialophora carrionii CBS 160.54]|uniref:Xylanolytic transcriptional activator regulatory domain-containing protein n=1 Tax=Cladophialophora carrionii CBS 160.54 TaxID=1279043 RepID=V9DHY7_9EURO|nr:uncharacterized protein G647_02341 [Cladophialophora carrionii CBS 160.54]ETI25567.1 hypothetical protein G647_02341 [Cladophialophora carrionii CBS 160.54]